MKIPEEEGFKRLKSLIQYQSDNFEEFELKEARDIAKEIKTDPDLTKEEKEKMEEEVMEILRRVNDFYSISKQILENEGKEIEVGDSEFSIFRECVKNQLELSECRMEDYQEDRFHWGKGTCQILINDETIFQDEIKKFYNSL